MSKIQPSIDPPKDSPQNIQELPSSLFLTDINYNSQEGTQDKINELHNQINNVVQDLNQHIDNVLYSHEQSFLDVFKMKMHTAFKTIRDYQTKAGVKDIKLERDAEIKLLKEQIEVLQTEHLRTMQSLGHFKKEINRWKYRAEALQDDNDFLEKQVKEMKRQLGKQGTFQTEPIIGKLNLNKTFHFESRGQRKEHKFSPQSVHGKYLHDLYITRGRIDTSLLKDIEQYIVQMEQKCQSSVNHYKSILRQRQKQIQMISSKQTKTIMEKTDLENLFVECVEEVRREVHKRRTKNMLNSHFSTRQSRAYANISEGDTRFTPSDKYKILELLVSNEQLLIHLYERIFPYRASQFPSQNEPAIELTDESYLPEIQNIFDRLPEIKKTEPVNSSYSVSIDNSFVVKNRRGLSFR